MSYKNKICPICEASFKVEYANTTFCPSCKTVGTSWAYRALNPRYRLYKIFNGAKSRSIAKGTEFTISPEFVYNLWDDQQGCCALTGVEFDLEKWRGLKGKVSPYAPSLDRIDSTGGYTENNVRLICHQMNIALSVYGLEQFEDLINNYRDFN